MTDDRMGTLSVKKLLIQTSIPLTLSLLISSLYNFVDSIFVSYVSENALTALSLSAPIQTLASAFGCGIAIGLNAVISKALGEKNEKAVKNAASAAISRSCLRNYYYCFDSFDCKTIFYLAVWRKRRDYKLRNSVPHRMYDVRCF